MSSGKVKPAGRGQHGTFTVGDKDEHSPKVERYKGVKRSPARPEPHDRRSSSESRISGGSGAAAPLERESDEPRFDGSYSYVFPDRSSPSGMPTSGGNAQKPGETRGAHAANGALGRTSSNASEVQSPLRELPEHDLAEALAVEASLREDLTDKPLSFSDTMGLKWLAPQEERPGNMDQPWANCRNEGAWSIAAGRPASADSGESFAFPEVLPREVLQFAEAPLKPLPDYDCSGGEGGTPRGVGGPLEQSWIHHRQQESLAASPPPKAAASNPPIAAAHVPQTAASPAHAARSRSPSPTTAHAEAASALSAAASAVRPVSGHSPTQTPGAGAFGAAGSPVGGSAAPSTGGRSPEASGGGRGRGRERSLSPEPGALVRNPAHPLHSYSPWSAGLEAYATQLQGSCPRRPPSSCSRAAMPSPGPGTAPAPRPACRSLRKQFEVAASPSITSHQTPPGIESPPAQQQQQVDTERASSAAPHTAAALDAATPDRSAAGPGPTVTAKSAFLGSAGMMLTHGLRAVRGLQNQIWWPKLGATPASPNRQQSGQQTESGLEGVRAAVGRICEAGWVFQGHISWGMACVREACCAEPLLEKSGDRSIPSPSQISDAVTHKVVRKQLVFLVLAFLALSAAALLPIALVIARHAAAAAAAKQAPAPVADNNDYTCLGLPDISGLPDMWGQLLVAVRRTAGLAVAQPKVGV
ncbi:g2156 [Coccomyxa elongata]